MCQTVSPSHKSDGKTTSRTSLHVRFKNHQTLANTLIHMNNILAFLVAHWAALVGAAASAHAFAVSIANFYPDSKAASYIEMVYDYFVKLVSFVQPFVTRNSQSAPVATVVDPNAAK